MATAARNNDGMGSRLYGDAAKTCRFRVWAPFARRVRVMGDFTGWDAGAIDLASEGNGNWSTDVTGVAPLQLYKYLIDNAGGPDNDASQTWQRADARALQVENSGGAAASYVVQAIDQSTRPGFRTPAFPDFILYQLHVGSFAGLNDGVTVRDRTATFVDVIDKLSYVRDRGFNGIQLLPIGDVFNDLGKDVGEGYGTSDMFAPEDAYGTTPARAADELRRLVDEAHVRGLAVLFDVVYNHGAIDDNRYWRYDGNTRLGGGGGEYFESGHDTRFGSGFAMWRREIKDFFIDNGRMFLRDYRADGLRFDAVQFIPPEAVSEIVWQLRGEFPDRYLIAEYNPGDSQSASTARDPFGELGFDATWDLASPGQAYAALDGDSPVDNLLALIGDFRNPNPWCSIRYLAGSHDQIYDEKGTELALRYLVERFGGRLNGYARAKARLAWALNATLPGTPMLFMGTEGHLDGYKWVSDGARRRQRMCFERWWLVPCATTRRRLPPPTSRPGHQRDPEETVDDDRGTQTETSRSAPITVSARVRGLVQWRRTETLAAPRSFEREPSDHACEDSVRRQSASMPCWMTKSATASTPSPPRIEVKTNGRSPRILRASRSITSSDAPTWGARSVLLMTRRSERVIPGPPLRGILSPPATSIT